MEKRIFDYEGLSDFCLSLAHLLHAGLLPGDALSLMAQDEKAKERKELLNTMVEQADAGAGIARVLEVSGKFPPYVCAMAAAGEETGRTEEAFFALADYYENRTRLERRIKTTLTQPLILFGLLLVVTVAVLVWVLPVFDDVYRQIGASLTGVAGWLLSVGKLLRERAVVALPVGAALCAGMAWFVRSAKGRELLVNGLRHNGACSTIDTARLTQVLSMALRSGLDEMRSMELALSLGKKETAFRRCCEDCLAKLREGEALPAALLNSGLMPAADCRLLEAGFRGGCSDEVMTQLAERIQVRSEEELERKLNRIEPALVLVGSGLVGMILLSVLLPLTHIMAAIG